MKTDHSGIDNDNAIDPAIDPAIGDRLSTLFSDRSRQFQTHGAGAQQVRKRATDRRTARTRAAIGCTTAAALIGGATWVMSGGLDEAAQVQVGTPGGSSTFPAAPPIEWSVVDRYDLAAMTMGSASTDDGTRYQLSTAPGVPAQVGDGEYVNPVQTLYSSRDGEKWSEVSAFDNYSIKGIAARGNDVYVVGTAASTKKRTTSDRGRSGRPGDVVVRRSGDGGRSWDDVVLPIDLEKLYDDGAAVSAAFSVASNADSVVVAATYTPLFGSTTPGSKLLQPGQGQYYSPSADRTGLDLMGPAVDAAAVADKECPAGWAAGASLVPGGPDQPAMLSCVSPTPGVEPLLVQPRDVVLQHVTWAEAGIEPSSPSVRLFRSTDGENFEDVAPPALATAEFDQPQVQMSAYPGGFAAVFSSYSIADNSMKNVLWTSTDGTNWTAGTGQPLPQIDYVQSVGSIGGHLAISCGLGQSGVLAVLGDDGAWSTTDPADVVAQGTGRNRSDISLSSYGVVPSAGGYAVLATQSQPAAPYEVDGYRLVQTGTNLGTRYLVTKIDDGSVVADLTTQRGSTVEGRLRIDQTSEKSMVSLLDEAGSQTIVSFDLSQPSGDASITPSSPVVAWTPDGVRWGVVDLDEVVGSQKDLQFSYNLGLSGDRITIPFGSGVNDQGEALARRAIVGVIKQ